jgi:hypothetical protein
MSFGGASYSIIAGGDMELSQGHSELFQTIVQADQREPGRRFLYAPVGGLTTDVQHPGLPYGKKRMPDADIEMLGAQGYIEFVSGKTYFVLTAAGPEGATTQREPGLG